MTYMDIDWMDRFMQTYDEGSFKKQNIRGFYADLEADKQNIVTNWYAGHITAPKNWADGKTITVKNGVFLRNDVLAFYGNEGDAKTKETAITIGSGTATNYVSFASAYDSNVKVKCEGDGSGGVKITMGVCYR